MGSIMCAQNLWRALLGPKEKRSKPTSARTEEPVFQNVIFGPWAATLARFDGQDLVIAVDMATHLTLVFRLGSRERLRRDFSNALSVALEDLGAPPRTIAMETAVAEAMPIVGLPTGPYRGRSKKSSGSAIWSLGIMTTC